MNIWKDIWVPYHEGHLPSQFASSNITNFSQLIDKDTKWWDVHMLSSLFPTDIVNKILRIRLPMHGEDIIRWKRTRDGNFSVKSAYNWLRDQEGNSIPSILNQCFPWKKTLGYEITPKDSYVYLEMLAKLSSC